MKHYYNIAAFVILGLLFLLAQKGMCQIVSREQNTVHYPYHNIDFSDTLQIQSWIDSNRYFAELPSDSGLAIYRLTLEQSRKHNYSFGAGVSLLIIGKFS